MQILKDGYRSSLKRALSAASIGFRDQARTSTSRIKVLGISTGFSPAQEYLRKINHNRVELARVSAGVTSSDVWDRRGCVNVFAVVFIPAAERPWCLRHRSERPSWREQAGGRGLYFNSRCPPASGRPVCVLVGPWHACHHGGMDHHYRDLFCFPRKCVDRLIARQAEMQFGYEDRIAELRAQVDRFSSRQLLDQEQYEQSLIRFSNGRQSWNHGRTRSADLAM